MLVISYASDVMKMNKVPLFRILKKDAHKERGASLVEYGLLVALIAVVGVPAVRALGNSLDNQFDSANTQLAGAAAVSPCNPFIESC